MGENKEARPYPGCISIFIFILLLLRENRGIENYSHQLHFLCGYFLEMVRSSKRKKMLKTALVASMSALLGIFVSGLVLCISWRKLKRKGTNSYPTSPLRKNS